MNTFTWPIRIYYEDTDHGGVVYYANYLKYLERARTEWLRALGFEQDHLIERDGIVFAVRSIALDYLKPAHFNDRLSVSCQVHKLGRASLDFEQHVWRDEPQQELVRARVRIACVDRDALQPRALPTNLREAIERLGEPA